MVHRYLKDNSDAFSQGGGTYSSKLSDDILESIELFKLTKPTIACIEGKFVKGCLMMEYAIGEAYRVCQQPRKQFQERLACPTRNFPSYQVRPKLMSRSRGVTSFLNSPQEWIHPNFFF